MSEGSHGTTRERQVRDIAACLGVADFVYFALPVMKGRAQREVSGDGLLIVGQRGAILQVKARDPLKGQSDPEERAKAWVRKNARKAMDQGLGTKRELARRQAIGTPVVVLPVRTSHLPAPARSRYEHTVTSDTRDWPIIVIIDHPRTPKVDLEFVPGVVWFTFDDWRELLRRLRSTSAVIEYVQRILRDKHHVVLGHEGERYAVMRAADEATVLGSASMVPYLADTEHFDELGTDLFHEVINRVWPDDGVIPWRTAEEYRAIVEFLDVVPPQVQSYVGRWILRKRSEIADERKVSSGLVQLDYRDRLVFACSHLHHWADSQQWLAQFTLLTSLRHIQALESGASDDTTTLGVAALVEERSERAGVSYSFVMLSGLHASPEIPAGLRRNFEWRYGIHNHRDGTTLEITVRPDEACPCMSGRQFQMCCGGSQR